MPLYRDVGDGIAPAGTEYYLPLFFNVHDALFHYLPRDATVVPAVAIMTPLSARRLALDRGRYEERRYDIEHPVLDPAEIFVVPSEWTAQALSAARHIVFDDGPGNALQATSRATGVRSYRPGIGPAAPATPPRPAARRNRPKPLQRRCAPANVSRAVGRRVSWPPRAAARPAAPARGRPACCRGLE